MIWLSLTKKVQIFCLINSKRFPTPDIKEWRQATKDVTHHLRGAEVYLESYEAVVKRSSGMTAATSSEETETGTQDWQFRCWHSPVITPGLAISQHQLEFSEGGGHLPMEVSMCTWVTQRHTLAVAAGKNPSLCGAEQPSARKWHTECWLEKKTEASSWGSRFHRCLPIAVSTDRTHNQQHWRCYIQIDITLTPSSKFMSSNFALHYRR